MNVVVRNAALGAVGGFLTRPCCVLPAALSLAGVSSAGLSAPLVAYRGPLLLVSGALLVCSICINFRRDGGWFNRALAVSGAACGFVFAAGWLGVW